MLSQISPFLVQDPRTGNSVTHIQRDFCYSVNLIRITPPRCANRLVTLVALDLVKLTTKISHCIPHGRKPFAPTSEVSQLPVIWDTQKESSLHIKLLLLFSSLSRWVFLLTVWGTDPFPLECGHTGKGSWIQSHAPWSEHRCLSLLFRVGTFPPAHTPVELLPGL